MSTESRFSNTGIRFNDLFFSEPVGLSGWTPPKFAGLFILLVKDPNWAPKAFQPLYFGEIGNNSPASAVLDVCKQAGAAAHGRTLYVSVLPLPFTTAQQRWALRNELIWAYNPVCQTDFPKGETESITPLPRRPFGFVSTSG